MENTQPVKRQIDFSDSKNVNVNALLSRVNMIDEGLHDQEAMVDSKL